MLRRLRISEMWKWVIFGEMALRRTRMDGEANRELYDGSGEAAVWLSGVSGRCVKYESEFVGEWDGMIIFFVGVMSRWVRSDELYKYSGRCEWGSYTRTDTYNAHQHTHTLTHLRSFPQVFEPFVVVFCKLFSVIRIVFILTLLSLSSLSLSLFHIFCSFRHVTPSLALSST